MKDYIEYHRRRFDFIKQEGKYREFESTDDTVIRSFSLDSSETKVYRNDCVFLLDSEKEEIVKYTFNKEGLIDKETANKFTLQNGTLKEWGGHDPKNYYLNTYHFYSEAKNEEDTSDEHLAYRIEYSPQELKAFVNKIFLNLEKPCFEMTTIIRFFKDGGSNKNDRQIKEKIYKYVLLPNKRYSSFSERDGSRNSQTKRIKRRNAIIYEDHTKYYPPKKYSLDAKKRFVQNLDCYKQDSGTYFYDEYMKARNKPSIKKLLGITKKLSYKDYLLKNQKKKLKKNNRFTKEHAYSSFQEEYEQNKQMYREDLSVRDISKEEYIDKLENVYVLYKDYQELKKWIAKTKEREPRGYGLTIGSHVEPNFKRYFSTNARGYYFYKDIVIMFSVDGYGKDFIYEFKTCIARTIDNNLQFAKEQANLYAYLTGKKKIIIEIFSYEEDRIYFYEYTVDYQKATKRLEEFYKAYKKYVVDLAD